MKRVGRGLKGCIIGSIAGVLLAASPAAPGQAIVETYFIPFGEDAVHTTLNSIDNFSGSIGDTLLSTISILMGSSNTVVYFDHWEDGYEDDPRSPVQDTTEIWGDGVASNGIPPGYAVDVLDAGDVVTLSSEILVPRDAGVVEYDGRDKISVTRWVGMSRAVYALDPGEVLAGSGQVLSRGKYGFEYRAPVGTDSPADSIWEYATMQVMAGFDSTVLQVDADSDGVFEDTVLLDEGDLYEVRNVYVGGRIVASRPVQAHLFTGDVGSRFEMRVLTLFPSSAWDDSYYTPIPSRPGAGARVFAYNPNTNAIKLFYETTSGTQSMSIDANTSSNFVMPSASGARLFTTNGAVFIPVSAVDATGTASANETYDWGHGLVSDKLLTSMTIVPWGPGSGGDPITANGNPLWVIALSNTTLYVDFDADPGTGSLIDPMGNRYDQAVNVTRLASVTIQDTSDNDQGGMRVYTLDHSLFTAAWGQDASLSSGGNPYLDMGSAILPYPTIPAYKSGELYEDLNTNGLVNPGDAIRYFIVFENNGYQDASDVVVYDGGASNTTFQSGTLYLNGTNVADDVVPPAVTPFPLDEMGFTVGDLDVGATALVSYIVRVNDPFPTNVAGIVNGIDVDHEVQVFIPVSDSGLQISKVSSTEDVLDPLDELTYTITVVNTSDVVQTGLVVSDPLPAGTWWVTNSTSVKVDGSFVGSAADEFESVGSYAGDNGGLEWLTDWTEIGESDGGSAGYVQVLADGVAPGDVYMLRISGANRGASRTVNLSGMDSAVLSFTYRRSGLDDVNDYVAVYVSGNGGASWTELDRFTGAGSDSAYVQTNYVIDGYIGTGTVVGLWSSGSLGATDYVFFDDVEIAAEGSGVTHAGRGPPDLLENYELAVGAELEVSFRVGLELDIQGTQLVNHAWVSSIQSPEHLSAYVTNLVNPLPIGNRVWGQVTDDLDADADPSDTDPGIGGVTVVLFTDPNGDGNPVDGEAVRTNVTAATGKFFAYGFETGHYVLVETDLPAYSSVDDSDGGNDNQVAFYIAGTGDVAGVVFWDWYRYGLKVDKFASEEGELHYGQEFTYTIIVTNRRTLDQPGLYVNEFLPSEVSAIGASLSITAASPTVTETWKDDVDAVAYTNNNGTKPFLDAWTEEGDDGNPYSGDVLVELDSGGYRINLADDDNGIWRAANLSGYESAHFSFDYRRNSLESSDEYLVVEVAEHVGAAWQELGRYAGPGTDAEYQDADYDISSWMGTGTVIRFSTPAGGMSGYDNIYIDEIKISAVIGGVTSSWAGLDVAHPVTNHTMRPGETVVITFQASVGVGLEAANRACASTDYETNLVCGWVTNPVAEIMMTQGVLDLTCPTGAVQLGWTAATSVVGTIDRPYDLLFVETGYGWHAGLSNQWKLAERINDSHCVDHGGEDRCCPGVMGRNFRFYRASHPGSWELTNTTRFASRQVYVAKGYDLVEGENWISLSAVPDQSTVVQVFGTNLLPSGSTMHQAARVEWYGATQDGGATNIVWLASPGVWMHAAGGVANSMPVPLTEGCNVVLPPGSDAQSWQLVITGQLPTNMVPEHGHVQLVKGGGVYNVLSYAWPRPVTLAASGLRFCGFTGAPAGQEVNPNNSDEIRILQPGVGSLGSPKVRILMDESGEFVFWTGGTFLGSAENYPLQPDDAVLIYSRMSSEDWSWVQDVPYQAPSLNMTP